MDTTIPSRADGYTKNIGMPVFPVPDTDADNPKHSFVENGVCGPVKHFTSRINQLRLSRGFDVLGDPNNRGDFNIFVANQLLARKPVGGMDCHADAAVLRLAPFEGMAFPGLPVDKELDLTTRETHMRIAFMTGFWPVILDILGVADNEAHGFKITKALTDGTHAWCSMFAQVWRDETKLLHQLLALNPNAKVVSSRVYAFVPSDPRSTLQAWADGDLSIGVVVMFNDGAKSTLHRTTSMVMRGDTATCNINDDITTLPITVVEPPVAPEMN